MLKHGHELTWRDYLKTLDSMFKWRAKVNAGLNVASTAGAAFVNGYSTYFWRYWKIGRPKDARSLQIDDNIKVQEGKMMQETPDRKTAKKLIKDEMEIMKKVTSKAGPYGEIFEDLMNEALEEDPYRNPERAKKKALEKLKSKVGVDKIEKVLEQFGKD